ncbi:MAG: type II secretion system F family protein [Candidatus Saccharimonadales bacterium]
MANYSYIAVDSKGKSIEGVIDAQDRNAVIDTLTKQALRPVSIKEVKSKEVRNNNTISFGIKKVKTDQLVMFTRQLSTMIGAGVPLLRALNALSNNLSEKMALKQILNSIIHDVEGGKNLGDSLAKFPEVFNDVYVNMVRAGEAAGILDEILNKLASQQEKSTAMRKKIKSAMAYPLVLLFITVTAFFGLMIFIVPQIGEIVTDLGGEGAKMPTITIIMLGISDFMVMYWYIVLIAIGVVVFLFMNYIKTTRGRSQFHSLLLKLPIINTIIIKISIAHFARTFSALMEAGVAVLEAIDVTSRAVGNAVYEKALVEAEAEVKNGKNLSAVMSSNPIFPSIVAQMLAVGEETGQTGSVLLKVADFYEEEVDASISGLSSIIEPVMIVVMGTMVGLIAASVMLPIAGLSQTIQ